MYRCLSALINTEAVTDMDTTFVTKSVTVDEYINAGSGVHYFILLCTYPDSSCNLGSTLGGSGDFRVLL